MKRSKVKLAPIEYALERKPGVHRMLITTVSVGRLLAFDVLVGGFANLIERRGDDSREITALYTVLDEHLTYFMRRAHHLLITVQQRVDAEPYWHLVFLGLAQPWTKEKLNK